MSPSKKDFRDGVAGRWGSLEGRELWGWPKSTGRRLRTSPRKAAYSGCEGADDRAQVSLSPSGNDQGLTKG